MNSEVRYESLEGRGGEYSSKDGSLSVSMNLVNESDGLVPIGRPSLESVAKEIGERLLGTHPVEGGEIYISEKSGEGRIMWRKNLSDPPQEVMRVRDGAVVKKVLSVGNVLIVLTDKGQEWALWEGYRGYRYLGDRLPDVPISFGLSSYLEYFSYVKGDIIDLDKDQDREDEEIDQDLQNQLHGAIGRLRKKGGREGRLFSAPFLVRYALRLYDGSLVMHSAPVYMDVVEEGMPTILLSGLKTHVYSVFASLNWRVLDEESIEELRRWKDVVLSVDVFVSSPLDGYDQNGRFRLAREAEESHFVGCKSPTRRKEGVMTMSPHTAGDVHRWFESKVKVPKDPVWWVEVPRKSGRAEAVRSCGTFYFLKSLSLDELTMDRVNLELEKGVLDTLETREVMEGGYHSRDRLIAEDGHVHNGKLHLSGGRRELGRAPRAETLVQYCTEIEGGERMQGALSYRVGIEEGGVAILREGSGVEMLSPLVEGYPMYQYLYYPNAYVKRFEWICERAGARRAVEMQRHTRLDGSVYYDGSKAEYKESEYFSEAYDPRGLVSSEGRIHSSEGYNPFLFTAKGEKRLSVGRVLGMVGARREMSQGQFGQFPLYVFTTEGVNAVELSPEGDLARSRVVSRDVCINPSSITNLDRGVVFASKRGIMLLDGSTCVCISEELVRDGGSLSVVESLPRLGEVIEKLSLPSLEGVDERFEEYIKSCEILYSYEGSRLVVFRKDRGYAYVYSLESRKWGMMESDLEYVVSGVSEPYAVTRGGDVVRVGREEGGEVGVVAVSRSLKLGAPDVLKSVRGIIQRGDFMRTNGLSSMIWGSRDNVKWDLLNSSTTHYLRGRAGSGYKYFRVAVLGRMRSGDVLNGCSIEWRAKETDKMR